MVDIDTTLRRPQASMTQDSARYSDLTGAEVDQGR